MLHTICARLRREQRGMALAEMLVTITTFAIVMCAVMALLDATASQGRRDRERSVAIREAQAGLHRMTRELRHGYKVLDATPKSMYVVVARSTPPDRHVKYDCDVPDAENAAYRRCVRWAAPVGEPLPTGSPGEVVIDRSLSEVLFTYSPGPLNPTYVRIHVEVPQRGELKHGYGMNLVLDDGFYLRNTDVAN